MDAAEESNDVVHLEVRAHINSLVSALGGASVEDDGSYKLGVDALEVLRDLRKWIRFYDEKLNRMDVARCLAEANLISGDLLPILATWPENASDNKTKARMALACFELIAPLTWPMEKNLETMTVNHHRHLPALQLAQLGYKRDIINFDGARILHTAVRIALPSLAIPIGDRTPRDSGVIKLVLYFLRNMAMIAPPPGIKFEGDETQISRSATIDAFSYQDIFLTILTIASNMGEDFRTEDVVIMEIIFHLVKRVDIENLFLDDKQLSKAKTGQLNAMINKEAAMLRSFNRNAPTRHNRFGTMVWVKRGDGKMSTITGQDALSSAAVREAKMDNSKKFRPPRRARREEMEPKDLGLPVSLNARANGQLRSFVEEFLDSGFNPLFQHVRKTLDREAPYVMNYHRSQFFYLVAWFLEAERVRKKSRKDARKDSQDEVGSFNLVAGVLNQEMFITLNRALSKTYNDKEWRELTATMRCFTQILLTVQDMSESGNDEDEEIAENILNRLFYEDATHDAVASLARTYKGQGFEYLDACTELTHTYLRILEAYSKQNVDMQVRSRKRTRRKKKAAKAARDDDGDEGGEEDDDSANDEKDAEKTSQERKFDFKRFANRFIPQGVVDTFVSFTGYYSDLSDAQLKRAHRYFHRVAFKQDMSVMLFRVDILHLFYNMIKGPEALDKNCTVLKDWEELVKQLIKKCVRKIEERPALIIEMLFSKINATAHYLEFGFEKQTISSNPRPGAELEFRHIVERDQQIAIVVGVLLDKGQPDHIDWVKRQLMSAESERLAWENAEKAISLPVGATATDDAEQPSEVAAPAKDAPLITVRPDNDAQRTAVFKNPHLRLLMRLVDFERLAPTLDETPESVWVVPSGITAAQLKESLDFINKAEFNPPTFENGESAEEQLRRKSAPRKRANFDDDGDDMNDFIEGNDEILFPAGGPTVRKVVDDDRQKGTRRRRQRSEDAEGPTEAELDERRKARQRRELEKARRIKSDMYVHASDEESDEERDRAFFAREEAIRSRVNKPVMLSLAVSGAASGSKKKRKSDTVLGDEDDDDLGLSSEDGETSPPPSKKPRKTRKQPSTKPAMESSDDDDVDMDSDDDDVEASEPTTQRKKSGALIFLDDSSDEDEVVEDPAQPSSQQSGSAIDPDGDNSDDAMETDDTPLSLSPHGAQDKPGAGKEDAFVTAKTGSFSAGGGEDDEEDGPVTAPARNRARARTGFIMDSIDEE